MNDIEKTVRKIWWTTKIGHSTYLMFLLAIGNFILITYNYFLEGNTIFENHISNLWAFGIIFLALYFPISIIIGRWHTSTQISVDMTIRGLNNPIQAKMIKILLDVQTGNVSSEKMKKYRKFIAKIENKQIE
jgi:hypothetical protein